MPLPDRCPLCQQPNQCALAPGNAPQARCWCMDASFSPGIRSAALEALPAGTDPSCLCAACVQRLAALG